MKKTICSKYGKPVCAIRTDENGYVYSEKRVSTYLHQLRVPKPAFAYDECVIHQCGRENTMYHVLVVKETKSRLYTHHSNFERHGFIVDRGYGRQMALELKFWTEHLPPFENPPPPMPEQFGLDF